MRSTHATRAAAPWPPCALRVYVYVCVCVAYTILANLVRMSEIFTRSIVVTAARHVLAAEYPTPSPCG